MLYLEDFAELVEFDRCELASVVADHTIYYTEPRKQLMQELNSCPRSRSSASENLRLFRVTIHYN